jgi:hypothetical protein
MSQVETPTEINKSDTKQNSNNPNNQRILLFILVSSIMIIFGLAWFSYENGYRIPNLVAEKANINVDLINKTNNSIKETSNTLEKYFDSINLVQSANFDDTQKVKDDKINQTKNLIDDAKKQISYEPNQDAKKLADKAKNYIDASEKYLSLISEYSNVYSCIIKNQNTFTSIENKTIPDLSKAELIDFTNYDIEQTNEVLSLYSSIELCTDNISEQSYKDALKSVIVSDKEKISARVAKLESAKKLLTEENYTEFIKLYDGEERFFEKLDFYRTSPKLNELIEYYNFESTKNFDTLKTLMKDFDNEQEILAKKYNLKLE